MYLEFALAIFIIRYLRSFLQKEGLLAKWDRPLVIAMAVSIGLVVMGSILPGSKHIATLLMSALLLYIAYTTFTEKEFLPAKSLIYAISPYVIVLIER